MQPSQDATQDACRVKQGLEIILENSTHDKDSLSKTNSAALSGNSCAAAVSSVRRRRTVSFAPRGLSARN